MCIYIYSKIRHGYGEWWFRWKSNVGSFVQRMWNTGAYLFNVISIIGWHANLVFSFGCHFYLFIIIFFTFTGIIPWRTLSKEDDLTLVIDLSIMPWWLASPIKLYNWEKPAIYALILDPWLRVSLKSIFFFPNYDISISQPSLSNFNLLDLTPLPLSLFSFKIFNPYTSILGFTNTSSMNFIFEKYFYF